MIIAPKVEINGETINIQVDFPESNTKRAQLIPTQVIQPLKWKRAMFAGALAFAFNSSGAAVNQVLGEEQDEIEKLSAPTITIYGDNNYTKSVLPVTRLGYNEDEQLVSAFIHYSIPPEKDEVEAEAIKLMKSEERHVIAKGINTTPRFIGQKPFIERYNSGEEIVERAFATKPKLLKSNLPVKPRLYGQKNKPLV